MPPANTAPITIQLSDGLGAHRYEEIDALLQRDAYGHAAELLDEILKRLPDRPLLNENADLQRTQLHPPSRTHQILFIEGPRGAGKTTFLLNLPLYLKNHHDELAKNLHILGPIDPTLIDDTNHFLSTLLAHVMREVSPHLKHFATNPAPYAFGTSGDPLSSAEPYYAACRAVTESMEALYDQQANDPDLLRGSAMVALKQESMKLEWNLHYFFAYACQIIGVRALVLPIDDIDMVPERGYSVLEVLRKHLVSPYVIPIGSGQMDNYENIVTRHYYQGYQLRLPSNDGRPYPSRIANREEDPVEKEIKGSKQVANAYLEKVFPHPYRIHLKSINDLLLDETVQLDLEGKGDSEHLFPYNDFTQALRDMILFGVPIHQARDVTLRFNTARDFHYLLQECRKAIGLLASLRRKDEKTVSPRTDYINFLTHTHIDQVNRRKREPEYRGHNPRNVGHKDIRQYVAWDKCSLEAGETDNQSFSNRKALLAAMLRHTTNTEPLLPPTYHLIANDNDEKKELSDSERLKRKTTTALVKLLLCVVRTELGDDKAYLSPVRYLHFIGSIVNTDFTMDDLRGLLEPSFDDPRFDLGPFFSNTYHPWNQSVEYHRLQQDDELQRRLKIRVEEFLFEEIRKWRRKNREKIANLICGSFLLEHILEKLKRLREPHVDGCSLEHYADELEKILKTALLSAEGRVPNNRIGTRHPSNRQRSSLLDLLFPEDGKGSIHELTDSLLEGSHASVTKEDSSNFILQFDLLYSQFRTIRDNLESTDVANLAKKLNELIDTGLREKRFDSPSTRDTLIDKAKRSSSTLHKALKALVHGGVADRSLINFCDALKIEWAELRLPGTPD